MVNENNRVAWAAFFWGLIVFMPVGMNYLAILFLLSMVIMQGDWINRWTRVKQSNVHWGLGIFLAWTLIVLVFQKEWYAETGSNLGHIFRIGLTFYLALSLSSKEAKYALNGFMLACLLTVGLIMGVQAGVIPIIKFWDHLVIPQTNKTIGASILLSMCVMVLLAYLFREKPKHRWLAIFALVTVIVVITTVLSKRTAMVGVMLGSLVVVLHVWRDYKIRWLIAMAMMMLAVAMFWAINPGMQLQFEQGLYEIKDGMAGIVKVESWNIRIHLIRHTVEMLIERPVMGWGIGAWNEQWQSRVPQEIAGFNMPHNDALWMGAQAGVMGAVAWLLLMLSGLKTSWKNRGWMGSAASASIVIACFSALVNNGTRDATIGLSMLWVMCLMISFAREYHKK